MSFLCSWTAHTTACKPTCFQEASSFKVWHFSGFAVSILRYLASCCFCIEPWGLFWFLHTDVLHWRFQWQVHPLLANLNGQVLKIFLYLRVTRIQLSKWEKEKVVYRPASINEFFGEVVCLSNTTFDTSPSVTYKLLGTVVASISSAWAKLYLTSAGS